MKQSKLVIKKSHSVTCKLGNIILTARFVYANSCELIIGSPGIPNIKAENAYPGDAKLIETIEDGVLEVRILSISEGAVSVLVSQISPRPGMMAGFVAEDQSNTPFTSDELIKITESIVLAKNRISKIEGITNEQLDLIHRKLDEIEDGSKRLGRKDWVNFTAGLLTNISIAAAFSPSVTRDIFSTVDTALRWLFTTIRLLS